MKIVDIEVRKVNVPLEAPIRWSQGVRGETTRTIVQMHTDEGIVGLGETKGDEGIERMITSLSKKIVGDDPFDVENILTKFHMVPYFSGYAGFAAIAGLEMAMWDIMGKATNRPVYDLLGGRYREEVPFSAYVFYRHRTEDGQGGEDTPERVVEFCREVVSKYGFSVLKLKGGVFPPEVDIATLRALREEFGKEVKLRVDPNGSWSAQTAIQVCRELAEIGLEYVEDPTWGLEGMARLRKEVSIPFATNMCVVNFDELPLGIRMGAVDIILADPHKWGGILACKKLIHVCEVFQLGVSMHSGAELGISIAANLHIAASSPQIQYAIDGHYHQIVDDIIDGGKHKYRNGCMKVPSGHGLGVALDDAKFQEYAERHDTRGDVVAFGNPQKGNKYPRRIQW